MEMNLVMRNVLGNFGFQVAVVDDVDVRNRRMITNTACDENNDSTD